MLDRNWIIPRSEAAAVGMYGRASEGPEQQLAALSSQPVGDLRGGALFEGIRTRVSEVCLAAVRLPFRDYPKGELLACRIDWGNCSDACFRIPFEEAGRTFCPAVRDGDEVMPDKLPRSFVHIQDVSGRQHPHCHLNSSNGCSVVGFVLQELAVGTIV
jgi:hypothetical protein